MVTPRLFLLIGMVCFFFVPPSASLYGGVELELDGVQGVSFDNYNRVDGLPVSYGLKGGNELFEFHLGAIYRIASERVGWRGNFTIGMTRERAIELSLEAHSITDTHDGWRIGDFENSLSSLLFKEDFRNYFERQGFSVSVSTDLLRVLTGALSYRYDRYTSLKTMADFSLFGWDKEFRSNLSVAEGWMGSLFFNQELDTRDDLEWPSSGWYQSFGFEIANPGLGGDFDFHQTSITLHRYTGISRGINLDVKFFGSFGSENAPPQRGAHIHGVGGLRGFPDDFTPYRRAFVSSIEGRIALPKKLRKGPFHRDRIDLLLFTDIGGVQDRMLAREMEVDGDMGVGIEGSGLFSYSGVFLAMSLDGEEDAPRLTFRIRKDFQ